MNDAKAVLQECQTISIHQKSHHSYEFCWQRHRENIFLLIRCCLVSLNYIMLIFPLLVITFIRLFIKVSFN